MGHYKNVTVRTEINRVFGTEDAFTTYPDVSVGSFIDDYHELVGNTLFCLAPRGFTPWTIHLYVAILGGCIPIILSDHFQLPFSQWLDYSKFSVRWPEKNFDPTALYHYLKHDMSFSKIEEMQTELSRAACWFDYDLFDNKVCSPFVGVVRQLQDKLVSLEKRRDYAGQLHKKVLGYEIGTQNTTDASASLTSIADVPSLYDLVVELDHCNAHATVVVEDYHTEELIAHLLRNTNADLRRSNLDIVILARYYSKTFSEGYTRLLSDEFLQVRVVDKLSQLGGVHRD